MAGPTHWLPSRCRRESVGTEAAPGAPTCFSCHWGEAPGAPPPSSWLIAALLPLRLLAAGRRGRFASVQKRQTFPGIAAGPLLHFKQRNDIRPGYPTACLCLALCKDFISVYFFYFMYLLYTYYLSFNILVYYCICVYFLNVFVYIYKHSYP